MNTTDPRDPGKRACCRDPRDLTSNTTPADQPDRSGPLPWRALRSRLLPRLSSAAVGARRLLHRPQHKHLVTLDHRPAPRGKQGRPHLLPSLSGSQPRR
jgi:hypothetical protein